MNKRVLIIAAFLLFAVGVRAWVSIVPPPPQRKALAELPREFKGWKAVGQDTKLADDVAGVLKADDYVMRRYVNEKGEFADLFIAYYKTQKAGESMHSPKNCLPGSGWTPVVNDTIPMDRANASSPYINRYIIEKDSDKAMALYWYQASGRVIASEYSGKFYLVYDALRSGRRDGAIVRVMVPLRKGMDQERQQVIAQDFSRDLHPNLAPVLPN
jgi:EpsI family protein